MRCYTGGRDISRNLGTRIPIDREALRRPTRSPCSPRSSMSPAPSFWRGVRCLTGLASSTSASSSVVRPRTSAPELAPGLQILRRSRGDGRSRYEGDLPDPDARLCIPTTVYATVCSTCESTARVRSVPRLSYWGMVYMLQIGRAVGKGELGKARAIALALVHGISQPGRKSERLLRVVLSSV